MAQVACADGFALATAPPAVDPPERRPVAPAQRESVRADGLARGAALAARPMGEGSGAEQRLKGQAAGWLPRHSSAAGAARHGDANRSSPCLRLDQAQPTFASAAIRSGELGGVPGGMAGLPCN